MDWEVLGVVILGFVYMVMDATDALPSWERNRMNAIQKTVTSKDGTTIAFEQAILQDPEFRRGVYSTNFIEQLLGRRGAS